MAIAISAMVLLANITLAMLLYAKFLKKLRKKAQEVEEKNDLLVNENRYLRERNKQLTDKFDQAREVAYSMGEKQAKRKLMYVHLLAMQGVPDKEIRTAVLRWSKPKKNEGE